MKTEHKLYAAIAVLVVLAVAVYFVQRKESKQMLAHAPTAATADLPKLSLTKDDTDKLTRLEITNKDKGTVILEKVAAAEPPKPEPSKADASADGAAAEDEELDDESKEASAGKWKIVKPIEAVASSSNVKSLLDNLQRLEVVEAITRGTDAYGRYELEGDKAIHLVAYKGEEKVLDIYFGKSGSRGQLARIAGVDGVYAVKGYSSYLYSRELKNWRETEIWKLEDKNIIGVEIENGNGKFSFSKSDDKWSGTFLKREKGKLQAKAGKWERFDESKLKSMLTSYKTLRAIDFAEKDADTGLDAPVQHGGVVVFHFKDNAPDRKLEVGKKQKNDDRYARDPSGDGTVYVLSSYIAKWAVANASDFEKPEEKKDDKEKKEGKDNKKNDKSDDDELLDD